MSDELLEFLGIAAGGIAIYLVAQNNAPAIKKAVSNISPTISNIIPVSTRAPQDDRASAPRGTCPPGYSPDYTLGILRCHDSHGTRELNPNVKMFNPQWQNAWGDDGWASPPLIPTPSPGQTLAPPKPEPQTLREPSRIISSVNPQIKKSEEKEKKVHTQVECPKDLSKMKCGSNCYKDGKLYKIVCSEAEREALYPPKKTKKKSITVPANFPSDVTISPGETPYPEVGDQPGGEDVPIPPLQLAPGPGGQPQQQILPTIPSTVPGRGPTATTPAQIVIGTPVLQSVKTVKGPQGQSVSSTGSYIGKLASGPTRRTNRAAVGIDQNYKEGDGPGEGRPKGHYISVRDAIGGDKKNFHITGDFHPQGPTDGKDMYSEITGAYMGSTNNATTVGLTMGIKHDTGEAYVKTEDHGPGHPKGMATHLQYDSGSGINIKRIPGWKANIPHKIHWVASNTGGGSSVRYDSYIEVGGRSYKMGSITNPSSGGRGRGRTVNYTNGQNTFARARSENGGEMGTVTSAVYVDNTPYVPGNTSSGWYSGPEGFMDYESMMGLFI